MARSRYAAVFLNRIIAVVMIRNVYAASSAAGPTVCP
jgi:hypothetical protein